MQTLGKNQIETPKWLVKLNRESHWGEVNAEMAEKCEQAVLKQKVRFDYVWNGTNGRDMEPYTYEIDLQKMTQTNRVTGRRRKLLRVIPESTRGTPESTRGTPKWLCQQSWTRWAEFEGVMSEYIEQAVKDGNNVVEYIWLFKNDNKETQYTRYEICLSAMTQTNTDTGTSRNLLRAYE